MALCTDNTETAQFANTFTQLDVGSPSGHIGRNSNRTTLAGVHDNLCFFIVVFRIKNFVRNPSFYQFLRNIITGFNRNGTDQNWLAFFMTLFNILNNCLELRINTWVEQVRMVNTCYRTVGWDRNNTDVISFAELFFLCLGCTCHAGQLLIHTEEVLIGNRSRSLCFFLNRHTFFGFNRLVETVRVATSFHCPTSKLINNQNFLIFTDHIVNVKEHDVVSSQSIVDKVSQGNIFNIVEIVQLEVAFCLVNT